jgi:hypothetical protein
MPTRIAERNQPDWLLAGSPTSFRAESLRALDVSADLTPLTSGVMLSVALPLQPGNVVTNLSFVSGATAAGTPTAYWFALYDTAGALISQSANQGSAAWAANTVKTLALGTAYSVTRAGVYYAAVLVAATTPPSLLGKSVGIAGAAASILSSKVLAQTSGSGLTTTAPATIASPTTVATIPLVIAT